MRYAGARTRGELLLASSLAALACVHAALSTGNLLALSLLVAPALAVWGEPRAAYTALLYFSIALLAISPTPISLAAGIAVTLCGVAYAYRASEGGVVETVAIPPIIAFPAYLLATNAVLPAVASLLSLLVLVAREYLRVGKSRVEVSRTSLVAYLNTTARVPIRITCPGAFRYSIALDGRKVLEGLAREEVVTQVSLDVSKLGTTRRFVEVRVSDPKGLARVEHEPVVVEVRAQSRLAEMIRRAEAVIRRYLEYVTAPVVLEAYPLGVGLGGGGGRGLGGPGAAGAGAPALSVARYERYKAELRWRVPERLASKLEGFTKSLTGEYLGVREYQPGDSPRDIHWKKSVRVEGRESLAVKVFGSERQERASGGRSIVVVADLTAPNPSELDALLQAVYSSVLMSMEREEGVFAQTYLYLKMPSGKLYFLGGKALDVLYGLNALLVDEKVEAAYSYESWVRSRPPVVGQPHGAIKDLEEYFIAYGDQLAGDLEERGVRKGAVVQLVFSKAMAFKYYYVSMSLRRGGYGVAVPGR